MLCRNAARWSVRSLSVGSSRSPSRKSARFGIEPVFFDHKRSPLRSDIFLGWSFALGELASPLRIEEASRADGQKRRARAGASRIELAGVSNPLPVVRRSHASG